MIIGKAQSGNIEIIIDGDDSGAWQVLIKNPEVEEPVLLLAMRTDSEAENATFIHDLVKALLGSVNNIEENDMNIRDKLRELGEVQLEEGVTYDVTKTHIAVMFEGKASRSFLFTEDGIDQAIAFVKGERIAPVAPGDMVINPDGTQTHGAVESEESPLTAGSTVEIKGFSGIAKASPEVDEIKPEADNE